MHKVKNNKNDYSLSFYTAEGKRTLYLHYVHNLYDGLKWAQKNAIPFDHVNVYYRRDRSFIFQIRKRDGYWYEYKNGVYYKLRPKP
jgi:hypothetical protein